METQIIIAGGGLVGLTTAHVLHSMGLDFVLLEQSESIDKGSGAVIVLTPTSLRVLHQLNLLEAVSEISVELEELKTMTTDGAVFGGHTFPSRMRIHHGKALLACHRADFIQVLYNRLQPEAKARILCNQKITSTSCDEDGVTVQCSDGTQHEGHILVGADGVHSKVRQSMRKLAMEHKSSLDWDADRPYTSTFKSLWCALPPVLSPGQVRSTEAHGRTILYMAGKDKAWLTMIEKLDKPTSNRVKYTEEDITSMVESFADFQVTDTHKLKEIYPQRLGEARMTNLEEGIVRNWSWQRIVLVGDACHKFTPDAGLGYNNGVEDVTVLCNHLLATLQGCGASKPNTRQLNVAFARYHQERSSRLALDMLQSSVTTRANTWATPLYRFVGRHVLSQRWVMHFLADTLLRRNIMYSPVLTHISKEEPFAGRTPWVNSMSATLGSIRTVKERAVY